MTWQPPTAAEPEPQASHGEAWNAFWSGATVFVVAATICALVLHWAGVL